MASESDSSSPSSATQAAVNDWVQAVRGPSPDVAPLSEEDSRWEEAAALAAIFTIDRLRAAGITGPPSDNVARRLRRTCQPVHGPGGEPFFELGNDQRRAAFVRLASRNALTDPHRPAAPFPDYPLQRMLDAYLGGSAPPLREQTRTELVATGRVVDWLRGLVQDLPDQESISRWTGRQTLLDPLRALVSDSFVGRSDALAKLAEYVGIRQASKEAKGTRQRKDRSPRPFVIHGPGGVGKSSVLARFLLDLAEQPLDAAIPFVYIDFDRPDVEPHEPVTLLLECARQLAFHYPDIANDADVARRRWRDQLNRPQLHDSTRLRSGSRHVAISRKEWPGYVDEFVQVIKTGGLTRYQIVLALDSLEDVQYGGQDVLANLWDFIGVMRKRLRSACCRCWACPSNRCRIV